MNLSESPLGEIVSHFFPRLQIDTIEPFGNGHINKTYLLKGHDGTYILQRLNKDVFHNPEMVMGNIGKVTSYLEEEEDEDAPYEVLSLLPTLKSHLYHIDQDGNYWRIFPYFENTMSLELPRSGEDLYEAGKAFGDFLYELRDFPSESLVDTIPDFHNTPKRYQAFLASVEKDPRGRAKGVSKEILYLKKHASFYPLVTSRLADGRLPYRVCHNDTKLNNLLYDKKSGKAIAVIDLDTVMKGSLLYDFGDAIRSSGNTALENEKDCSKVSFSLPYFERFSQGYLIGSHGALTPEEYSLLSDSVLLMALELAMRFLKDYLDGDVYFGISYPEENLVRARGQLTLAEDLEKKLPEMKRLLKGAKAG
jgi:Ser/Thr protein kinase RdoA (MazF antagonist)